MSRSAIQSRSRSRRVHDVTQAEPLLEDLAPDAAIADKGYDSDAFFEKLEERDITPVIPPKAHRKEIRDCDFALIACATPLSASSIRSSTKQRASTSWPTRFSLASCSPAWSLAQLTTRPSRACISFWFG